MESYYLVLWWVLAGYQFGLVEVWVRLEQFDRNGLSVEVFIIGKFYGFDGLEVVFNVMIDIQLIGGRLSFMIWLF